MPTDTFGGGISFPSSDPSAGPMYPMPQGNQSYQPLFQRLHKAKHKRKKAKKMK